VKRTPNLEKRPPRQPAPRHSVRPLFPPSSHTSSWQRAPELDEGPDAAFREVSERIARGDLIRGHAF